MNEANTPVIAPSEAPEDAGPAVAVITFRNDPQNPKLMTVSTKFPQDLPAGEMFRVCGKLIEGIMRTCLTIGRAKQLTDDQVLAAMGLQD